MSNAPSQTPSPARRHRSAAPWRRLLTAFLLILGTTGVGLWAYVWWEERPLKEIESALAAKDYTRALPLVDAYLKSAPYSSRALDFKAQVYVGQRKFGDALVIYEKVGSDSLEGQRAWGEALLHLNRWSDALPLLQEVDRKKPSDPDVVHQLASCAMQAGDFDVAVKKAEELSTITGHRDRGLLLLGVLHTNHGNYRLATEAFEKLLHSNPDGQGLQIRPDELFQGLGQAYLSDGKPSDAIERLNQAIATRGTSERYAFLGDAWELKGDLSQAGDAWKQAVHLDPEQARAREGLARIALEEGQPKEVLVWLEPLSSPAKISSSIAHSLKRATQQLGDVESAQRWEKEESRLREQEERKQALDDLVKQSPKSYWALAVRAHRFVSEGNRGQAAVLLKTVESIRKTKPDGYSDPKGFVEKLLACVNDGGELPSLDLVPLEKH